MKPSFRFALLGLLLLGLPASMRAHCDTLDGPVVLDAKTALTAKDVTPVLKWIKASDEPEVRAAFERTLAVRSLSNPAAALADEFFFATLVRIHRAGEGAPFSGLKASAPAGVEQASDHALESGKIAPLAAELTSRVQRRIEQKFEAAHQLRAHASHSVEAGRAYVAAYVDYVHLLEAVDKLGASGESAHATHAH